MSAPNRAAEVSQITMEKATLPFPSEEARREFLVGVLIPDLNQVDSGKWSHLVKMDQGGKIPADIIVWVDTMEHIDVLTDQGPMWHNHGVVSNPEGVAGPVAGHPLPTPLPSTPPTTMDPSNIQAQLDNIALQNKVMMEYLIAFAEALGEVLAGIQHRQDRPLVGGNWRTGAL